VSSAALDTAVDLLRRAGALGAKLTGAGGDGGAVVALFRRAPAAGVLEREGLGVLTSELEPTP
jgi:mevalonate kinase